jgi:hypothetical protein
MAHKHHERLHRSKSGVNPDNIERRHAAYTAQSLPLQCSLLRLSLSADFSTLTNRPTHILTKRNILDRDSDDTARIVVIVVVLFDEEKKS